MSQEIYTCKMLFRQAEQSDLRRIIALMADDERGRAREIVSDPIYPTYQTAFDQIIKDPNHHLLVAEKDGRVVATCHLTWIPSLIEQGGMRLNIEAVFVCSSCRGEGIGTAMITHVLDKFGEKRGCKSAQLTSSKGRTQARKFYEKLGFIASHEGLKKYL